MSDRRGRPRPRPLTRRDRWVTVACLAAAVLILAASWLFAPRTGGDGESFGGTDSTVTDMLEKDGARPWFHPVFEPGSGEVESGLFALQAALGAGIFGYAVGRLHGRRFASSSGNTAEDAPDVSSSPADVVPADAISADSSSRSAGAPAPRDVGEPRA